MRRDLDQAVPARIGDRQVIGCGGERRNVSMAIQMAAEGIHVHLVRGKPMC